MSTGNRMEFCLNCFEVEDRKVKFKDGTLRDLQSYKMTKCMPSFCFSEI